MTTSEKNMEEYIYLLLINKKIYFNVIVVIVISVVSVVIDVIYMTTMTTMTT